MTTAPAAPPVTSAAASRNARRTAAASLYGTAIEWYDFSIYGLAAVLVFAPQFFPQASPLAGTLAALGTFAVGFVARPVGGILAGHLGDRIGRKKMLVLTLLTMGVATTLIGVLPTYAQIGVAAPIILVVLRLLQGLAAGGEWGGAVVLSVEHAPPGRRAFYGSFAPLGVSAGVALSNAVFLVLLLVVTPEDFAAWAWRIPFLLSAVLVVIGLIVRSRVEESAEFEARKATAGTRRLPLATVLRSHWRPVLFTTVLFAGLTALAYIATVFSVGFAAQRGLGTIFMITAVMVAALLEIPVVLWASSAADRIGRTRMIAFGAAISVVAAVALLPLLATAVPALVLLAVVLARVALTPIHGPIAAEAAEAFPTDVRYTGASLGYQLGSVLGGGLAPIVATLILAGPASVWGVSVYLAGLLVLGGFAAIGLGRVRAAT